MTLEIKSTGAFRGQMPFNGHGDCRWRRQRSLLVVDARVGAHFSAVLVDAFSFLFFNSSLTRRVNEESQIVFSVSRSLSLSLSLLDLSFDDLSQTAVANFVETMKILRE